MSLFSRLFGGGSEPEPEPETYKGFSITPTPIREGSKYRLSAKIEKDGTVQEIVRADVFEDLQTATEVAIRKAKQVIDEQERMGPPAGL